MIAKVCENSLKRLGSDHLDLYLLHWGGPVPLVAETHEGMEKLRKEGKIVRWRVSNFVSDDIKELWNTTNGKNCMINQVLYHLGSRGIEYESMISYRGSEKITCLLDNFEPAGDMKMRNGSEFLRLIRRVLCVQHVKPYLSF